MYTVHSRVQRFRLNKIIKKIHKLYFPELFRFFSHGFFCNFFNGFDICINLCDFTTQIKFLQKKLFCSYTLLLQNAHKTAFKRGKKSVFLALKFCNHQRPRKTELLHCLRQQILMPCMYAQSLCIYASMFIFLNVCIMYETYTSRVHILKFFFDTLKKDLKLHHWINIGQGIHCYICSNFIILGLTF
jgi:hypothetical protein